MNLFRGGGLKLGDRVCKGIDISMTESIMTDYIETKIIDEKCVVECIHIQQSVPNGATLKYKLFNDNGLIMNGGPHSGIQNNVLGFCTTIIGMYGLKEIQELKDIGFGSISFNILSSIIPVTINPSSGRSSALIENLHAQSSANNNDYCYTVLRDQIITNLYYGATFYGSSQSLTYDIIKNLKFKILVSYYPVLD